MKLVGPNPADHDVNFMIDGKGEAPRLVCGQILPVPAPPVTIDLTELFASTV
jgi:hypothetical protein